MPLDLCQCSLIITNHPRVTSRFLLCVRYRNFNVYAFVLKTLLEQSYKAVFFLSDTQFPPIRYTHVTLRVEYHVTHFTLIRKLTVKTVQLQCWINFKMTGLNFIAERRFFFLSHSRYIDSLNAHKRKLRNYLTPQGSQADIKLKIITSL